MGNGRDEEPLSPALRPQSIMLALLGDYVYDRDVAVFSGGFVEVLGRVGISEQATRSTLTRMVNRGLLARHRQGRRMFFGLTERSRAILKEGGVRIWETGVVNQETGGGWTLVGFSLPEERRRARHDLRTRLTWAGFGMLHSGLWIAPSRVEVGGILAELGLEEEVKVFTAQPVHPADIGPLIRDAYDLSGLARRYRAFLARWDRTSPVPDASDDLVRELLLMAEWLQIIRGDPRLPLEHLPSDWPAPDAQRVFRETRDRIEGAAASLAEELLETIPTP